MANQDDDNNVDYINQTNQQSKRAAEASGKAAKTAAKNSKRIARLVSRIIASAPILLYIIIIVIIVLYVFALYGFLTSMPGMFIGKLKETGRSFWRDVSGFITGNFDYVDSDDVKKLAQYLQNQGYDVQGYGFGDVKYTEDSETTDIKGATKKIDEVIDVRYKKNYLHSYIAASEETYQLAQYSVWGDLQATGARFSNSIRSVISELFGGNNPFKPLPESPNAYSTGLLNIQGVDSENAEINREAEQLVLYTNNILGIKFGNVFSYDLSGWTSLYGRPTELFIALHLATGMPDLTYEIATGKNFNTKININLQNVSINYGNADSQLELTTPGGQTYQQADIEKAYYDSAIENVNSQYDIETSDSQKDELIKLLDLLIAHQGNATDISNFIYQLYRTSNNITLAANNAFGGDGYVYCRKTRLAGTGPSGLAGVTAGELQELMDLIDLGRVRNRKC